MIFPARWVATAPTADDSQHRRIDVVRSGVRLAVDAGSVRVGVAVSDPSGVLATPEVVLKRDARGGTDQAAIAELVADRGVMEVLVGLPRSMSGGEGPAAATARDYAAGLAAKVDPVPVRLVDERLSTVQAAKGLQAAGLRSKSARGVIDAAAAVVILQHALDSERATGGVPGELATAAG